MNRLLFFIPEQASSVAAQVDLFFYFMVAVSGFFSLLIAGLIVFFALRYHETRAEAGRPAVDDLEHATTHGHGRGAVMLEIVWTVIPFALAMVMFAWGTSLYFTLERPPADALQLYAVGKQWMWKFQHPEGVREINELHVPLGQDIRLTMSSEDVIHSFFVPAFRVKQDVVPGRYTQTWFHAHAYGHLSSLLRGVLRHPALGHDRQRDRDGTEGLRGVARARRRRRGARPVTGAARRAIVQRTRLHHVPSTERPGPRARRSSGFSARR